MQQDKDFDVRLPTPWLRVEGALIRCDGALKLAVEMPTWLTPVRRYCQIRAHVMWVRDGDWMLEVLHEEPYVGPKGGRNAWQGEWSGGRYDPELGRMPHRRHRPARLLVRRWNQMWGQAAEVSSIIHQTYGLHCDIEVDVRVTPEGFQLRPARPGAMSRTGEGQHRLEHCLRSKLNHGAGIRSAADLPTDFEEEETIDMRSIDTTTSDQLPGMFAFGQRIVRCQFDDSRGAKTYGYFAGDLDIKAGDYAVVASPNSSGGDVYDDDAGGYLKVVRVVSVEADVSSVERAAKWLIAKVDTSAYAERRRRIEEVKTLDAQIARARKAAIELLELQQLAALSPALADLIGRRNELMGVQIEPQPATTTGAEPAPTSDDAPGIGNSR